MAFQKKKIDNIHPQALQQIKDVVEGKTPSQVGFGGKTPDVSGFTRTALDQIKSVVGGGSGGGIGHAIWCSSLDELTLSFERVYPEWVTGQVIPINSYSVSADSTKLYVMTYSENMPPADMLLTGDFDDVAFACVSLMLFAQKYDDGVHGPAIISVQMQ